MKGESNQYVKILFRYYSDVLEEETVETMWALPIDPANGVYKLENIPFYCPSVASDDIVFAEFDATENMLTYRNTIKESGNSVVQVVIMNKEMLTNDVREIFEHLGCVSEKFHEGYFTMEVPAAINYKPIKDKLNELKRVGVIEYAEPCLSRLHRY